MILFGLRDVGASNACLPVIKILKDKGVPVSVYAEGSAYQCFKEKFSFITECKMDDLFDFVKPSLVVATCAMTGGAVPIDLTNEAKKRNLPVLLVEDMWSAHSPFKWGILPDGVCVMDEFAKNLILKSWPNYSESNIHITGSSIFDKFASIDTESARCKLRWILGLNENWPVVFFPATGLVSGMSQVIRMLVNALNSLNISVYFILRDHPSVSFSKASEYRSELRNLKIERIIDSSNLTSNEVNAGSDIVVGTFSSMIAEACYMRKPVLIIWTSEIARTLIEATNKSLTEWPITNLGAALKAGSVDEIKICLKKIINGDTADVLQAQQKHFRADGLSASRIASVILSYY